MPSIFSKIIKGEIPSMKIAENEICYAFLDINPISSGHVLVVPKIQVDYFFDLEPNVVQELMVLSKRIAKAVKKATGCKRVGLMVEGFEVPHAHIHLVPINEPGELRSKSRELLTTNEMKAIAARIHNYLEE